MTPLECVTHTPMNISNVMKPRESRCCQKSYLAISLDVLTETSSQGEQILYEHFESGYWFIEGGLLRRLR